MIKITERGWAGHFICGDRCRFTRNTLIEKDDIGIVVSTVGSLFTGLENEIESIGPNRYYETMAFKSEKLEHYIEANTRTQISFSSNWCINANSPDELPNDVDNIANEMHDDVVREICERIESGEI